MEKKISIHAPLTGCDNYLLRSLSVQYHFNPRTPYGMRHDWFFSHDHLVLWFQSTHPLRDATVLDPYLEGIASISIHAPLTGCDIRSSNQSFFLGLFQSTHPLRDATMSYIAYNSICKISIHAPLTGCDFLASDIELALLYFNPRTPYGMRRTKPCFS